MIKVVGLWILAVVLYVLFYFFVKRNARKIREIPKYALAMIGMVLVWAVAVLLAIGFTATAFAI